MTLYLVFKDIFNALSNLLIRMLIKFLHNLLMRQVKFELIQAFIFKYRTIKE